MSMSSGVKCAGGIWQVTFTIATDAALSDIQWCASGRPLAIFVPGTWTAANLTFQGGLNPVDAEMGNLFDEGGNEVVATITAQGTRIVFQNASPYAGVPCWRIRSGTSGTPVNQAAERHVIINFQDLYRP